MEAELPETLSHPQIICIAEEPWESTTATHSDAGPSWVQTARTAQWYHHKPHEARCIANMVRTPDGTSLITTSANNTLETIILYVPHHPASSNCSRTNSIQP